ncbi:hypothetical protein [Pseudomonas fluorescens]|uniref:hypothetical protein n=1 Tax=Pseudomonas fluorescens TaxID=294 RepID=UPI00381B05EE
MLCALRNQRVTEAYVYGSHAEQPEWVQENLLRRDAHPENLVQEQLAMIPPGAQGHDAAIAAMAGGMPLERHPSWRLIRSSKSI